MVRKLLFLLQLCVALLAKNLSAKDINTPITDKEIIASSIDSTPKDSINPVIPTKIGSERSFQTFRSFKELEKYDTPQQAHTTTTLENVKEGFKFNTTDSLRNKKWLDMANNTFATIAETHNYVDLLSQDGLSQLPVAIRPKEISNVSYTVGVAKAVFKPSHTVLTIFLKVDTPKGTIILGGKDIKLSHEGGILGEARLNLISQFTMNFDKGNVIASLNGSFERPATYALIDCSGFKELHIDADVLFSKGLIHPVDSNGKKVNGYVQSNFKTVVSDWNDIIVNISLPEFGINGLHGTTFRLNNAVLDFSDLRNDPHMPRSYLSKYYKESPDLWHGVYISTLEVVLPREFKKKNQNKRIAFGASNLLIDSQGVTGRFLGENILSIDQGIASKWKFSLDRFLIDIETNTLIAGEFNGELALPVSKVERLQYNAIIQPDQYTLQVSSVNALDFDLWSAKVLLREESFVELKVKDGTFQPLANLHGTVNFASGLGKDSAQKNDSKTVDFKGIVFEDMLLQTQSPKLSVGYFGYKSTSRLANFPITINEIGLQAPLGSNRAELLFDFNINLSSEGDGGNGGSAKLAIGARLDDDNGRDRWRFDGVELERIAIAMDVAGTQLKGAIFIFEDDPTYGTGFAGAVGAKFSSGLSLEVQAKALFGRKENFRYWFADAQATIPGGIPIFTGFALNTFGGGIYNRMGMAGVSNDPNASFNQIGASSSGVIYEPNNNNGLGMKAMVGITTQNSEELFHASVEFGMTFRKSGGLNDIYFKGHGALISELPGDFSASVLSELGQIANGREIGFPASPPSGAMSVDVFIGYDFTNDIFHALAEIYVNYGVLKGVGAAGRAGWMDFYVSPDQWHILIGTPNQPVGIALNLGILRIDTKAYFMTGQDLPNSPPPPDIVAEILGLDASKLDYTRDLGQLKSGSGLAFGAHLSVTTGDLRFLIFYARFDAGLGFDIMIKDYADAHCKGSSEQIGLNGWYANGQAYAYLQGELGLFFKLFGSTKKFTIVKGGGAVIVQARLPNPAWFQGYLGGHYNLLGGLIKGRFRFKIELGDKCEIIGGSPIDGMVVIGDMTPKETATDVDVFAVPQVIFNMQLNKVFEIPDQTGDRKYKIMLDNFELTRDGTAIAGEIKWNNNNDIASFYSHEILPPNADIKSFVQLHFEEFKNGRWEVIRSDGRVALETKEVNFTTGAAPKTIPASNIAFMYPIIGQQNFFVKQYNQGYINLKRGQSYLFDAATNWKKAISINSTNGNSLETPFSYNASQKQVLFGLPQAMRTTTDYKLTVSLVPPSVDVASNIETTVNKKELGTGGSDNSIEVTTRKAQATISSASERELLIFAFRTSAFTTFKRKMNAMREQNELYDHITYPYGLALLSKIRNLEPFDLSELRGNPYTAHKPLIIAKASLQDTYYKNQIYPLLYQNYPLAGNITVDRKTDKIGVPPVEGVEPMSWYLSYLENGATGETSIYNPYRYNLTNYYHQDYEAIRYKLVNSGNYNVSPASMKLITDPFPLMRKGKYKTTLQYVLPGQVRTSKLHEVNYTNPLYE